MQILDLPADRQTVNIENIVLCSMIYDPSKKTGTSQKDEMALMELFLFDLAKSSGILLSDVFA